MIFAWFVLFVIIIMSVTKIMDTAAIEVSGLSGSLLWVNQQYNLIVHFNVIAC